MNRYRLLSIILVLLIVLSSFSVLAASTEDDGYKLGYSEGKVAGELDFANETDTKDVTLIKRKIELQELVTEEFLNRFEKGFEDGYKDGYKGAEEEKEKETIIIYGPQQFGEIQGRIDGYRAYQSGGINNWERHVPTYRAIFDMYELRRERPEHASAFIEHFRDAYKIAFDAAFQTAKLGNKLYSYEEGLKDGDDYARDLATINARKDYLLGYSSDYERNMPSNREITTMFNLNNEPSEYRDAFLAGFEFGKSSTDGKIDGGYRGYYRDAYREANKENIETPHEGGNEDGRSIGGMKGEYAALMDITLKKSNDWTRHKEKDKVLVDEYGLGFQSDNYRDMFITSYWNEFMKSYNATYKKLQQDDNKIKTHVEKISIDGKENIGIPGDDKFLVDIEAGTYYNDVILTIDNIPTSYVNPHSERHTQASGVYGLKLLNSASTFDNNKKLTIKFKSFGKDVKYGIYKYHFDKWVYIPSLQEGDYLTADINLKNISQDGNIYVVRVDNQLPIFHDSRGHWAKDEINTYVKREIIYGYPDVTFRPERYISRAEFVTMLGRLYNWLPPYDSTNVEKFTDFNEFGFAEKYISFATYYQFIYGYPDGSFRPSNQITYNEVEHIMSRITGNPNFKWSKYAEMLLYEKKVRSSSYDSIDNRITRAEFTFLLHRLNEEQY